MTETERRRGDSGRVNKSKRGRKEERKRERAREGNDVA